MRILVTEQGGALVKQLSVEKLQDDINKQNELFTPKKKSKNETRESKIYQSQNLDNLKVLEIKNKKLSIPKDIAEKYNEIKMEETSLLPALYTSLKKSPVRSKQNGRKFASMDNINTESTRENTIETNSALKHTKNNDNYKEQNFIQSSYKIKDIISDETLDNMRRNIIKEVNLKNRLCNNITDFRSPILTPKTKLNQIEKSLLTDIKSDKTSIISYLNSKQCVSPKLIKSIEKYDEEKFIRVNKICQRVSNNSIEDLDMRNRINGILENNHQLQKHDYKKNLSIMEKEIKDIKNICKKYQHRVNKEMYANLLYDMKRNHWSKLNLERLMTKGRVKNMKTDN